MTQKEKNPKRLTLKKRADKIWSELIRRRNGGRCEICGKIGTNPHHILGRKNLTLRHDLRNGVNLCYYCHVGGRLSAHSDSLGFQQWLIKNRRLDYNYLMLKRMELVTQIDYQEIIDKLKETKEKE